MVRSESSKSVLESKLIDAVVTGDLEAIRQLRDEAVAAGVANNQILMQDLVIEAVGLANKEVLVEIVDLLASDNLYAYEVTSDWHIFVLTVFARVSTTFCQIQHLVSYCTSVFCSCSYFGCPFVSVFQTLICKSRIRTEFSIEYFSDS